MGCDIHLKLERRLKKDRKIVVIPSETDADGNVIKDEVSYTQKSNEWRDCNIHSYNSTWSDRIYGMFARLAGVRDYSDDGKSHRLIPLRGFPEDAVFSTFTKYAQEIVPDEKYKKAEEEDNEWYLGAHISDVYAEKYCKEGYSEIIERGGKKYCTHPDWHSPNWCTTQEMETCINDLFYNKETGEWRGDYEEWLALLGAMKGYEYSGEYECRAVFWFDN